MNRATTLLAGAVGATAVWAGCRRYLSSSADSIAYRRLSSVGGVERRKYPSVVVAETLADTEGEASGRLRDYLNGANTESVQLPQTAPVRIQPEPVTMTTPGQPSQAGSHVRMGVYLAPSFTPQTAPQPTSRTVRLTVETPRTVAVQPVSRLPTADRASRTDRATTTLLSAVADANLVAVGRPFVFEYPLAYLPESLTRTEVAVEVV